MIGEARRRIGKFTEQDRTVLRESIAATLGHDVTSQTPPRTLKGRDELARDLFLRFCEILGSVENLANIELYIRRAPRTGVSKAAYLRYHVENYLAELYVLRERLLAYSTLISRRYKHDYRLAEIKPVIAFHRELVLESLRGLSKARGRHVHERRFDDEDLDRLNLFDIVRKGDDTFAPAFEIVYREVRSSKRAWIRDTNRVVNDLLELYFGALRPLLSTDTGTLRFPSS